MCGIVGAFPLNKTDVEIDPKLRRQLTLFFHNEVLFETIARGKDATGVAVSFGLPGSEEGTDVEKFWAVLKQPVDTVDFFLNDGTQDKYKGQSNEANVERLMDVATLIQRPLNHIIGHTRAKTVGSEFNPLNNHPILVGNIIGIHNGGVKNYEKIYRKHKEMTPQGEVDSEAIIQLLAENANDRALDVEDITYVTERIVGPRAVIAYNRKFPEKVIYFHDKDRPLELAYIEELGLALLCSERRFLDKALHVYSRSRLTLKRDLPDITVDWRHIPQGKGGVIDVTEEFEGSWKSEDLFPLAECATVLDEYDNATKITTTYSSSNKSSSYNNNYTNNVATKNAAKRKEALPEAEITDVTKYGYGQDNHSGQAAAGEVTSINATMVMDDDDDDSEDTEELNNIVDVYDNDELRKRGIEYVMSSEAQEDEELLINRCDGDFKSLIAKTTKEEDAIEIVSQLYPESFGDGFCVGFKAGAQEQGELSEEDNTAAVSAHLTELETKNTQLEAELFVEKQKQRKAAAFIANMKAFLMAAITTHQLGHVEGEGAAAHLVFDDDLEDFLTTAKGFHKANPEMVRDLFTENDLYTISNSMVDFARQVSEELDSSSGIEAAAKLRGITS